MCGLVAVAGAPAERIDAALAAIAHRGPDGRGTWRGDGVTLGHVRLAVVDPAGGAQPVANEDGSVVAIVNGELYGDDARWLTSRGHRLRSRCDSELLVHLYEELGDDVVRHVHGELAFVLWDRKRRRLLAARDRFGVKPLVWAPFGDGHGIALASEAKALFALGVPARWDHESFFHAAHVQYTWPDRTLFAGVHQVPPAHALVWDGDARIARYWDLPREASGDVREAIAGAVRDRLRADARVCVQLSGGLDSSSVAALARVPAFTVAFPGGERAEAEATAQALGIPLHVVEVDATAIANDWPAAVAHGEGLAINGHLVGKWRLSRAMRDAGFKVALTGEGADELFAGYAHLRRDAGLDAEHAASRGLMLPAGDGLPLDGVRARLGFVPTWLAAKATLGLRVRSLLSGDFTGDPYGELIDSLGPLPASRVQASAVAWMRTALASYILRTLGDGMEMAHGIEGRVPFLDDRVAAAAFALDHRGAIDKPVLRHAMTGIVPAPVLARPKQPFLAPPLSVIAPALVQDTLRSYTSPLVDRVRLLAVLDALPTMPASEQQAWDPALMLVLSAAILEGTVATWETSDREPREITHAGTGLGNL